MAETHCISKTNCKQICKKHAFNKASVRACVTRNYVEKGAVRWCHLTHQFTAGGEVNPHPFIPVNPKVELRSFVSKIFINHSILIKS